MSLVSFQITIYPQSSHLLPLNVLGKFPLTIIFITINLQNKQKPDPRIKKTKILINLDFQFILLAIGRITWKKHK